MPELLDKALTLATKGYHVLPLAIFKDGRKLPLIKWGSGASRDPEAITGMPWGNATHVAVACEPSGIVVVDIDTYYDEELECEVEGDQLIENWQSLVREHASEDAPEFDPPWVNTIRNGVHAFLRADPDRPMTNSVKDIAPCIDIRGVGGLVAIYADADEMPGPAELPQMPGWLYTMAERETEHLAPKAPPADPKYSAGETGTAYGLKALEGELSRVRQAWEDDDGTFNHTLNRASFALGSLAASGHLEPDATYQQAVDLLDELSAPPDQYKTVDSGFRSGYERPRVGPEVKVTDENVAEHGAKWLTGEELDEVPPPRWLVPGWLEFDAITQVFGPPKQGKTHVVHDMAASLSAGLSWPVKGEAHLTPQRVAYIVAEGVSGLAARKRAWEAKWGPVGKILYYPDAIQISRRSAEWLYAVEFLREWEPAMVVVDTQSRCTVGVNENTPQEMSVVVDCIEDLRKATGACVLLVHHTSRGGLHSRGTNAVEAALNTGILVRKKQGRFEVTNPIQKNAEEAPKVTFRLTQSGESVIPVLATGPVEVGEAEKEQIAEGVGRTNLKMKIREYLKSVDTWKTNAEIREALGEGSRPKISTALTELVNTDEVLREHRNGVVAKFLWNHSRVSG